MSEFNRTTDGQAIVYRFADQVKGRTFLLTGPTKGGIGAETVTSLAAESPAMIILVGRSLERIQPTIDDIKAVNPKVTVKFVTADLASLKSVRRAAQEILDDPKVPKIDVVINNAAVMASPFELTEDNLEFQLAANHLGHFVLTNRIIPKVIAAGPGARLVLVSSSGHRYGGVRFLDPNFSEEGSYEPFGSYGQSKSAVMLFAVALNKRLAPHGIHAYTLHPGSISTGLQDFVKASGSDLADMFDKVAWRVNGKSLEESRKDDPVKTLQQGCATTLRAALDPDLPKEQGVYLENCNLVTDPALAKEWAINPGLAEQCWALSEELVGETFDI